MKDEKVLGSWAEDLAQIEATLVEVRAGTESIRANLAEIEKRFQEAEEAGIVGPLEAQCHASSVRIVGVALSASSDLCARLESAREQIRKVEARARQRGKSELE